MTDSHQALSLPRLVIAGTASHVGKTTVMVGLARALQSRGLRVSAFKCGPDYLDPGYHSRAARGACHNLDGWMMGRDPVRSTFVYGAQNSEIALIEGSMGLFDGASPTANQGSTAEIAAWLSAPVLLVCDASGMARSIAALVAGFVGFDREVQVAGVIANRVGGQSHLELLRRACPKPPILGGLVRETELGFPERHLGLQTATAKTLPETLLEAWGERVARGVDLDQVLQIARAAPPLELAPERPQTRAVVHCRIGLAFDDAFHFYYAENLRALEAAGATLVRFSPLIDSELPEVDSLYFGGGYPELFAERLATNRSLRDAIRSFAQKGKPIYAECGGFMYLTEGIRTLDGVLHPMLGLLPGITEMRSKLQALGYVEVGLEAPSLFGPAGLRFRGHQFRYSELVSSTFADCIYRIHRRRGGTIEREGYQVGNVLGSYVHAHFASNPLLASGFVQSSARHAEPRG